MIIFYTPNGDQYTCVRHDFDHAIHGINWPCMACRREQTAAERQRVEDMMKRWTSNVPQESDS